MKEKVGIAVIALLLALILFFQNSQNVILSLPAISSIVFLIVLAMRGERE